MKIVYVDETFHPAYGYQSNPLAKCHKAMGNDVVIITVSKDHLHPVYREFGDDGSSIDEDDARYQKETGVRIVRVPTYGYFMHRAVYSGKLFDYVRKEKPDVVFVHCVETLTAMRFLLHRKEWPLLFDSHMLSMASQSKFVFLFEKMYSVIFRRIIEKNGYYVIKTQNDGYLNDHLGISRNNTPFISFGTDTRLFSPNDGVKREFRKENNIGEKEFVVVYTGKLTEAKGGKLLAEAFKEPFIRKTTLICVGSPPDNEYGKEVAKMFSESKNRIIMFPTQKYFDLPKYYQAADLSVFPKQCSLSFYDAQSCGLPVLSENNNVNSERCSHGNGENFTPGDVQDFRKKIDYFASLSSEEYYTYQDNARKLIESGYDYYEIAKQYYSYLAIAISNYNKR